MTPFGATSILLALLAGASAAGSWCAVVGMPSLGLVAAAELGIALDRPLLREEGAFDRLLAERQPAYESAADVIVDTDGKTADEVASEISERVP